MMSAVRRLGVECLFVGAIRSEGLPQFDTWEGTRIQRIGRFFPLLNGKRPLTYVSGVLSFWMAAVRLLLAQRPRLIHASDFETGVPAIIGGRILGVPVIYNIHDNLAARYALPSWACGMLNAMEGVVARAATVTLVPEPFRKDLLPAWSRARVRVVRNSPDDPGYVPRQSPPAVPPRILFAGWLDRDRGLAEIIHLASVGTIQLVVAGEGDDRIHKLLAGTPNTEYRGFCTHREIMALTAQCDYVAAFYNPVRRINRYAASNKIAESLAVGRPVLTNVELMVARRLVECGAAIAVPYHAIDTIGASLAEYAANPASYRLACESARKLYEQDYHSCEVQRATEDALSAAGFTKW